MKFTKCVYCMGDSAESKSVEHIIPESLGNDKYVLEKSCVCDKCNNYFSIHIEKPFLELEIIRNLRTFHTIPSKKGKIPSYPIKIVGDEATMTIKKGSVFIECEPETILKILDKKPEMFLSKIPDISELKNNYIVSRFLIKIFTEILIFFSIQNEKEQNKSDEFFWIYDDYIKEYMNYVRYGKPNKIYNYQVNTTKDIMPFPNDDLISTIELISNNDRIVSMKFTLYELEFILDI